MHYRSAGKDGTGQYAYPSDGGRRLLKFPITLMVQADGGEPFCPDSIKDAVRAAFDMMPEFLVRIENPDDARLSADSIVSVNILTARIPND